MTARTLACAGVVGATLFSVAHADKWLARGHGSAHADESRLVAGAPVRPAASTAPNLVLEAKAPNFPKPVVSGPQAAHAAQALAHTPRSAPAAAASVAHQDRAQEGTLNDMLRAGRRLLVRQKLDEAEAAYQDVLVQRSGHPGALAGLSRVSLARGDLDGALRFARLSVEAAPSHAVYHLTLADVLRARAETAAADLEYEVAARLGHKPVDRAAKVLPANPF